MAGAVIKAAGLCSKPPFVAIVRRYQILPMSRRAPGVVTADAVAHAAETSWMPLSPFRSYTVISIASHEPTVWRGHCQEVQKGINSFSGMGAQERDCPRWPEGNAAMAALPGVLGRGRSSGMARPCPALHCRMRSAWRGAGEPRLAGLCTVAGLLGTLAHLALA